MRKRYLIDTVTSVGIQKTVKIGRKLIEIFEGVSYREIFIVSPFRNVIDKLFSLRQDHKKEKN